MASSDPTLSISSVLECSICVEEFNEDNFPRTLPCSHVYCTKCLVKLARNPRGMVTCPACRKEHHVVVEELNVCRTTMALREIKHTKQRKKEAQLQKQGSDHSDSASTVGGQAQSASLTSDTDIQGLLTSLRASMWEVAQSGINLEKAINETDERRETLLQTLESAKQTVNDRMDQVIKTANEQRQQIIKCLEDAFQESLSQLADIKEDLKARQEAHKRFFSEMDRKKATLRRDAQADQEEIKKLIKEILNSNYYFQYKISIPLKEHSLDTDEVKYQSILTDVSSWGGIKTEVITQEVHPVQPNLAARTQHYLAKTKAKHISTSTKATCVAQLPNGDVAIGSVQSPDISVYDSDFKPRRVLSLSGFNPKRWHRFSGIEGICATPDGQLCINDPDRDNVCVVTPEGRLERSFKTCLPPLKERFGPRGLASNKEGEVFVCDVAKHIVRVFDQSGQECRRFGGLGKESGKLRNPWDLAVTPDGKVAVADTWNHRIQVFDGATGRYLATFGSRGSGPNQLDWPTGIAIDSMGFVAVAEKGNKRVQLFTPSWKSFHILKIEDDPFIRPQGIIFSKRNEIVVCDVDIQGVFIF